MKLHGYANRPWSRAVEHLHAYLDQYNTHYSSAVRKRTSQRVMQSTICDDGIQMTVRVKVSSRPLKLAGRQESAQDLCDEFV